MAAASSALRPVLAGPPQPAECLGVARGALYLRISEPPGALAVLCQDAVRLPCGLMLPATSAELALTSLAAASASFLVGDHAVRWTGPAGPVDVRAVREWAPARLARGAVTASALAAIRSVLDLEELSPGDQRHWQLAGCHFAVARAAAKSHPRASDDAIPRAEVASLPDLAAVAGDHDASAAATEAPTLAELGESAGDHDASVAAAAGLLGRGPGLTPSGDDVLAGYLVGAAAFGLDATALRDAVAVLAPTRTTAVSAALLWHAARGECIDALAAVAAVLTSQPRRESKRAGAGASRLPCGGDSSDPALAGRSGIAAERVLHRQAERAVSGLLSVGHSSGAALALGLVIAAETALNRQAWRAA